MFACVLLSYPYLLTCALLYVHLRHLVPYIYYVSCSCVCVYYVLLCYVPTGECTFGHSWAVRFRKRHNLPTRDQNGRKRKIRMLEGDGEDEDDILAAHVGLNGNSSSTTTSAAAAAAAAAMSSSEADLAMDATANASLPTATGNCGNVSLS